MPLVPRLALPSVIRVPSSQISRRISAQHRSEFNAARCVKRQGAGAGYLPLCCTQISSILAIQADEPATIAVIESAGAAHCCRQPLLLDEETSADLRLQSAVLPAYARELSLLVVESGCVAPPATDSTASRRFRVTPGFHTVCEKSPVSKPSLKACSTWVHVWFFMAVSARPNQ